MLTRMEGSLGFYFIFFFVPVLYGSISHMPTYNYVRLNTLCTSLLKPYNNLLRQIQLLVTFFADKITETR